MLQQSLTDSWSFFKSNVAALSVIILTIIVPIEIFVSLYEYFFVSEDGTYTEQLVPVIIGTLVYPIYAVAVVLYIASIISGEKIEPLTLLQLGIKFWWKYLVLSTFIGLIVIFGLILLVIPGVIFSARYAFAEFDLLLNQSRPLDAMKHSWDSTKEYVWVILGGYTVITVALYVPFYLVAALFDESSISFKVLDTVTNMAYPILGAMYTIFAFRVYELAGMQGKQSPSSKTLQDGRS